MAKQTAPRRPREMNRHVWRRWTPAARRVFMETLRMLGDEWDLLAPESLRGVGTRRARRILAWNTAWMAADAA